MAHTPTKHTTRKVDKTNADQPESPVPETEVKKQEAVAERNREAALREETWGERQARESIEAERELARTGRSPQTDINPDEGQTNRQ